MSYKWKYIAFCVWHNVLLTKITLQQNKLDTPWVGKDFTLQGYSEQDGKQYLYVLIFGVVLSHVLTPGRAIIFLVRRSLSKDVFEPRRPVTSFVVPIFCLEIFTA